MYVERCILKLYYQLLFHIVCLLYEVKCYAHLQTISRPALLSMILDKPTWTFLVNELLDCENGTYQISG